MHINCNLYQELFTQGGMAGILVKAENSCEDGPWFNSRQRKVQRQKDKNNQGPARNEKEGGLDLVMCELIKSKWGPFLLELGTLRFPFKKICSKFL